MIVIVEYGSGNVKSVSNALKQLNIESEITDDIQKLRTAEKVIFPGVGEASSAMAYLREKGLDKVLKELQQPFLGICLGLQLMCSRSEEGNVECLGIFKEQVKKFPPKDKVPHMGWNNLENMKGPLFIGLEDQADMYFVHSYFASIGEDTAATCNYMQPFSAALQKDNFYAVQFHPEKSAEMGLKILENFLKL